MVPATGFNENLLTVHIKKSEELSAFSIWYISQDFSYGGLNMTHVADSFKDI